MAKHRKRTNKNVPAKGRIRDMCDVLWSLAVKRDWAGECAICASLGRGKHGQLDSHHLIPRQHYAYRYDLQNGMSLCKQCHQFCPDRSPHQNAAGFMAWLGEFHTDRSYWYNGRIKSGEYKRETETRNAEYFIGILLELRQYVEPDEFADIVGVRFGAWLEENRVENVVSS